MSVAVTIDLQVDPGKLDEFLAFMHDIAPDTRAYDGCELFDIWVDQDKAGHVLFYEIWDQRADQEKYFAWRTETGVVERLGSFLTAPPEITYFDNTSGT